MCAEFLFSGRERRIKEWLLLWEFAQIKTGLKGQVTPHFKCFPSVRNQGNCLNDLVASFSLDISMVHTSQSKKVIGVSLLEFRRRVRGSQASREKEVRWENSV